MIGVDPKELKVGDKVLQLHGHGMLMRGRVIMHNAYGKLFYCEECGFLNWLWPELLMRDDGRFPNGVYAKLSPDEKERLTRK